MDTSPQYIVSNRVFELWSFTRKSLNSSPEKGSPANGQRLLVQTTQDHIVFLVMVMICFLVWDCLPYPKTVSVGYDLFSVLGFFILPKKELPWSPGY